LVLVLKGGYIYYPTWLCIIWRNHFDLELVFGLSFPWGVVQLMNLPSSTALTSGTMGPSEGQYEPLPTQSQDLACWGATLCCRAPVKILTLWCVQSRVWISKGTE